jgi:hypothetical protein
MTYNIIGVGSNAKTIKGDGSEYLTAITYLKPWKTILEGKTHNICPMAHTAMCHEGCLYSAGRGQMTNVQTARLRKTRLWIQDKQSYLDLLRKDLTTFQRRCELNNVQACYRPNGTSDIQWENYGIIEEFPDIQFYDYTKIIKRVYKKQPKNYHLTLSYSEANRKYADDVMSAVCDTGVNMAVVFRDEDSIPDYFERIYYNGRGRYGFRTFSMDKDDLRFLDPQGMAGALYAKGQAKKDTSGFVIDYDEGSKYIASGNVVC